VRALELRKSGATYREIARNLAVDTHTAHADVAAELAALRETTVGEATELRELELLRLDRMNLGLWPQVRAGSGSLSTRKGQRCFSYGRTITRPAGVVSLLFLYFNGRSCFSTTTRHTLRSFLIRRRLERFLPSSLG
jgi:hypothetical protein